MSRLDAWPTLAGKSAGDLGGPGPYGQSAVFPMLLGQRGTVSDAAMEGSGRKATTVAVCVARIGFDMAEPDLLIEKKVGKRKWERLDEDSPEFGGVAQVFQKANSDEGKTALWFKFFASGETFGRAPLLTDYVNFGMPVTPGKTFPRQLRYLYAPNVIPVFDDRRRAPSSYRYSDPTSGETRILRPDEILYHLHPRLDDPWAGASTAARVAIFAAIEGALGWYWHGWFRNGARAGMVLESDKMITPEQMAKIKANWNTEHGNSNDMAFSTWFLHSGFKLKELAEGQKDADFGELFRMTKEEIISGFGVPPVFVADFSQAALANIEEQTPIYYERTLMPRGRLSCENLTEIVGPRFDPSGQIRFRLDWDNVPAVKRITLKKYVTLTQAAGAPILSRNEARELVNLPAKPQGDELLVPFSMSPDGAPEPVTPAPAPPPPAKGLTLAKWIDSAARHSKRAQHESSMGRFMPSAERELRAFFTNQEQRLLSKLPEAMKEGPLGGLIVKRSEDDGPFDIGFEADATNQVLARIYARVASVRGSEAIAEVGSRPDEFLMDAPEVIKFLKDNGYKLGTLITETTAARIADVLSDAVANGETLAEMTTKIRDLYAVRRSDASRIARTEVSRSYNFSTQAAWKQSNAVASQEWLTSKDDHVRDSHAAIDGTTAPLDGTFSNGCAYPGDPEGPADETINCRCTTLPVLKADAPDERSWRVSPELAKLFDKKV